LIKQLLSCGGGRDEEGEKVGLIVVAAAAAAVIVVIFCRIFKIVAVYLFYLAPLRSYIVLYDEIVYRSEVG
jgi:hypothetical protein